MRKDNPKVYVGGRKNSEWIQAGANARDLGIDRDSQRRVRA